jgi:xylulokinase/glycerol kinase
MSDLIAAIDVGTTGTRTIIFNSPGEMLSSSYTEYPIITPEPTSVEQDANQWWQTVCKTSKKALKSKKIPPNDIVAIAVTNQRETIVPVDKNGEPLHNALVWQDRRTVKQCNEIKNKIGAGQIFKTTGLTIDPYFSAPKIMWFRDNKPKIFKKAHKFLLVHDYIVHKLTGEFQTDHSNASRTMLFDINKFKWNDRICEDLSIPIDKLPQLNRSGTIIGELTAQAAKETGLVKGTTVVAGGGDQQCAALGLGVVKEGLVKATTGTGTFVVGHLEKQKLDKKMRVLCSASVLPKKWVLEASIFTTGAIYRWFRDNFAEAEKFRAKKEKIDVYEILNQEIAAGEPGANGLFLIPHFVGAGAPYWNPNAKGMLYGLSLGHTKRDILRAVIEGVCFEIKNSLEVFDELGLNINELRIAGGAAKAPIWNQIMSDIYGLPVVKSVYEETTALGAAILASSGSGIYSDLQKAVKNMVNITTKYKPNTKLHKFYKKQFKKHNELYMAISKSKI